MSNNAALHDVLFVVVTCTKDRSREKALINLVKSLNKQHEVVAFDRNLLLFDNASVTTTPLDNLTVPARFAFSSKNIGYWSAINWALDNASRVFEKEFKFIHPIESDLVLFHMERLVEARDFLETRKDYISVRTQEFSVRHCKRFLKNSRSIFPVRRSAVADFNGVTNETVSFDRIEGFDNVYGSNWHSKVPALHRLEEFQSVFKDLAKQSEITEQDFMRAMHQRAPQVAVMDKGIFYAQLNNPFWPWEKRWLTGSWMNEEMAERHGYLSTRRSFIDTQYPEIIELNQPVSL